jgi:hypothetical protein
MLQHGSTTRCNHAAQPTLTHSWRVRSEVSRCVRRIVRLVQELRLRQCRLACAQEAGIPLHDIYNCGRWTHRCSAALTKRRFTLAGQSQVQMWASPGADVGQSQVQMWASPGTDVNVLGGGTWTALAAFRSTLSSSPAATGDNVTCMKQAACKSKWRNRQR